MCKAVKIDFAARSSRKLAKLLDDLLVYHPAAMALADLSAAVSSSPPSARASHGFTSAGSKFYVHGGRCILGEGRESSQRGRDRLRRPKDDLARER